MGTDAAGMDPDGFSGRPEWRWLRAAFLAAGGRPGPRADDPWVAHARDALAPGGGGPRAAAVRDARDVREHDGPTKWELEARLLTDQPLDAVAARTGLTAAAVDAYARVFFDVRPHLAASDWVTARAIGYRPGGGFAGRPLAGAWKLVAYHGGPHVLDVVIAATTGGPLPAGAVAGRGPGRAAAEAVLRAKARQVVALEAAATDAEVARVVAARQRLDALEAKIAGRAGPAVPMLAAMQVFRVALPGGSPKPPGRGPAGRGGGRSDPVRTAR